VLIFSSPVGFVGILVPSLKKYADDWWSALFKQAFFGPIMIFMIYMALKMMEATNKGGLKDSINASIGTMDKEYSTYSLIIVTGTSMALPIVILWVGFISAQKMGAAGAKMAVSGMKKAGNWARKTNFAKRMGGRAIGWTGRQAQRAINSTVGRIPLLGRAYRGVSNATFGRVAEYGDQMRGQADLDRTKRRIEREGGREHWREAQVREYSKNIDHINDGDELASRYTHAREDAEREAIVRRAANVGELGMVLNRNGLANDRTGLRTFIQREFAGLNVDQRARLAVNIAAMEAKNKHVQYNGVAGYNGGTNSYDFASGNPPVAVFEAAGGEHPQNVARNLRAEFIVTTNPGGAPPSLNASFEQFLQDLGGDFNAQFIGGDQAKEIPASVIRSLQAAITSGVSVPASSRTEELINKLRNLGRIT